MEYVQVALFQIAAARLDDASGPGGLLEALDEHRAYLEHQPGFQDMRIVRSINDEGNVQIVVETHWTDADSLVAYETKEPNVQGVIRDHQDMLIPNSLQVYDMEALRVDSPREPAPAVARERVALPLLVPIAAFLFGALIVYGLSRIYLEMQQVELGNEITLATPASIAVAVGILLVCAYIATRPVPLWQIGGIAAIVVAALLAGSIFTAVHESEAEAEGAHVTEPAAGGGAGALGGLTVEMKDNLFLYQGQRNPTIQVSAGQQVAINTNNTGSAIHNLRVAGPDGRYDTSDDAVDNANGVRPGNRASVTFTLPRAGIYPFRCDFHPTEMMGTLSAQ